MNNSIDANARAIAAGSRLNRLWLGLVPLLIMALVACSGPSSRRSESPWQSEKSASEPTRLGGQSGEISLDDEAKEKDKNKGIQVERFPGTGELINMEAARRPQEALSEDGEINLNFEGAPLPEVVRAILGDLLQENYVIGPGVGGEVTFSTARPIGRDQLLPILDMLLRWNNAAIVYKDERYNVLPVANAIRGNLVPRLGPARGPGFQLLAVPLNYIAPTEMEKVLEPYLQEGGIVSADNARGLIVLSGTPRELSNYMDTIEIFDVDWLSGMSVAMFTLTQVDVADVLPELQAIFGEEGSSPLAGMFRFVPLERINAVMVISTQPSYLDQAEVWITRLDRGASEAAASRLYVYSVENLEAGVLADYLLDIFGGERSQRSQRDNRSGGLTPGLEPVSVSTFNDQATSGDNAPRNNNNDRGGRSSGGFSVDGSDQEVRITAIEENNSLLIQASPSQYQNILTAIERLDIEPLQVLIEAQIIEVMLTDDLQYGVNWFLSNFQQDADVNTVPGLPGTLANANFNPISGTISGTGNTLNFISRGANGTSDFVKATITALDQISDVRTLSAPTLLVRNNSQARINVGTQVSVQATQINTGVGNNLPLASNQFINTGTTLDVTPRVNPGGLVYLEVNQVVSSPGARPTGGGNPDINNSEVSTEVAVQSGQTVVLGGLIRDSETESSDGVPFLSRIPILGALFGAKNRSVERSELVVMITPTVVSRVSALQEVSDELRKKFVGLRPIDDQESGDKSQD
ncbi:MAG: type II secretion system secretin GspD [Wenzhouxiangellaceae bacterium]